MPTKNYDPQSKIRLCERHKWQFIFEYHLY